jgi:hypothetical protein
MNFRLPRLLALVVSLVATFSISATAAVAPTVPTISSVRGKVVFVKVPPGFESVSLRQKTGLKTKPWKALGTKQTDLAGGTVSFLLKSAVARRALYVSGELATPTTSSKGAGTILFPADPALGRSNGFSGAGGSLPGVVSLSSAAASVSIDNNSASAPARSVVESDIWRVAGDRLYFFNELRGLQVFDVSNPDDPVLRGQLREPNHGEQMYLLDDNHVALLTRASYFFTIYATPLTIKAPSGNGAAGAIVIADVTTGHPQEIGRVSYPGYLVESRLVGTVLYVVSEVSGETQSGLQVTSFDLSDPANPTQVATLSLGSYGGVVTATDRFLFVVRYAETWRHSTIDVIDISDPNGALRKRGKIEAAGFVEDKFKMELAGDTLTVVSSVPFDWSGAQDDPDNISRTMVETFSLTRPAAPVRLGSLAIGTGESVRATRFADGRLYVVTFFSIDPLWVIDLADPRQPTLLGELEVPGFSNYIEPLGDRLVAVGHVGAQTAVSLFDVSDPAHPALLSQIPLGNGYSYSEANWDEKAFSVMPEANLIVVPYSGYDHDGGWASRVQLIDLTTNALTPRGVINQGLAARRTALVHDRLVAISSSDLVTVNISDRDHPSVTSDVEIAWRVDRVFLAGNHLVEIGGAVGWSTTTAPTITVSTAADPDTALTVRDLDNVPVVGATVRDGRLYVAQQNGSRWSPIYFPTATNNTSTAASNPLILSVFDLSALPALPLLGRTEADVDPSYGYGAPQLEAAWPNASTLVWLRPQWTSWWWGEPISLGPIAGGPIALDSSTPTAGAGITIMTAGTLSVRDVASTAPTLPTTASPASDVLGISSIRWIPPWYRSNTGHEMLVFDVSTPSAPTFTTKLDVRIGQTGDWSAPISTGGKLFLSYVAYDEPVLVAGGTGTGDTGTVNSGASGVETTRVVTSIPTGILPRKFRHFMKCVDFADATHPAVGLEVNIPGRLLAISGGGATLLTVGCGFDADGQPTATRVFHTSSFDGTTAQLVDQLATPSSFDPYALDGSTLVIGTWPLGAGQTGQLQSWLIGGDGKFSLAAQIDAPTFTSLSALHGLLVGFGAGSPRLFDVSDPANLLNVSDADTNALTGGDLSRADGGADLGIWQPLGDYGVGVVSLKH